MPPMLILVVVLLISAVAWMERGRLSYAVRALFHRRTWFRLLEIKVLPVGISLRPYRPEDRQVCLKLYTDNEVGHFPPGFVGVFEDFLDRQDLSKLLLCENDLLVAIGGIQLHPYLASHCAWLLFGLVDPALQNRGLGAALLVSRIALLPQPSASTRLFMTNVAKSQGYFERFGFGAQGTVSGYGGPKFPCNSALLDAETWRACRERANALGLKLPDLGVPKVEIDRLSPAQKPDPLARGRTGFSKLDEAVLLQLGGLISLLVIRHHNNVMGWALVAGSCTLIVWGGIMYRRELRRRKAKA